LIRIAKWLNIVLILFTVLALLAPYIDPRTFWIFAFFAIAFPSLILFNILFLFFWVWKKKWYLVYSLAVLILGWKSVLGVMGFGTQRKVAEKTITFGTYNISALSTLDPGSPDYGKLTKQDFEKFLNEVGRIDILCTQETEAKSRKLISSICDFPYYYQHQTLHTCIFSKNPILNHGSIIFKNSYNSAIWTDLKFDDKVYRVFCVHLQSNSVSNLAKRTFSQEEAKTNSSRYQGILKIMSRIKNATILRANQSQQVEQLIRTSPYPVIIGADLNDTPQSYVYAQLSDGLKDSFKEGFWGLGSTYNGRFPFLRIDYILTDKKIEVINHKIIRVKFSDHYPIFSKLKL